MGNDIDRYLNQGESIQNQEILPLSRTKALIVGNTENRYYFITKKKEKIKIVMSLKSFEAISLKAFPWQAFVALGTILLFVGIGLSIGLPGVPEAFAPVFIFAAVFILLGLFMSTKLMLGMKTAGIAHRPGYILSKKYEENIISFIQIVHGFTKFNI